MNALTLQFSQQAERGSPVLALGYTGGMKHGS